MKGNYIGPAIEYERRCIAEFLEDLRFKFDSSFPAPVRQEMGEVMAQIMTYCASLVKDGSYLQMHGTLFAEGGNHVPTSGVDQLQSRSV